MNTNRILPIASGSSGNCMLLELDGTRILIDLGVSASMLRAALTGNGYTFESIAAVLITHTHSDHVKGLEVCLKRIAAPIFMSGTSKDTLMLERAKGLLYSVAKRTYAFIALIPVGYRTSVDVIKGLVHLGAGQGL